MNQQKPQQNQQLQPQANNAKRQSAIQLKKYINQLQGTGVLGIYNKYLQDYKIFGKHHDNVYFDQMEMDRILKKVPGAVNGKISVQDLKKRMCKNNIQQELCNPNADISLINTVFQGKQEINAKDIYELWNGEPITDYDPLQECLNLICDQNEILDLNKMSNLMEQLGYQKLDKQDQVILIEIFDIYRDKKIDKKDLIAIFTYILQHTTGI